MISHFFTWVASTVLCKDPWCLVPTWTILSLILIVFGPES